MWVKFSGQKPPSVDKNSERLDLVVSVASSSKTSSPSLLVFMTVMRSISKVDMHEDYGKDLIIIDDPCETAEDTNGSVNICHL